jgi:hypothetical protein
MNDQKQVYRKRPVLLLLAGGLMGVLLSVESTHAIAGQCKDMTINPTASLSSALCRTSFSVR